MKSNVYDDNKKMNTRAPYIHSQQISSEPMHIVTDFDFEERKTEVNQNYNTYDNEELPSISKKFNTHGNLSKGQSIDVPKLYKNES